MSPLPSLTSAVPRRAHLPFEHPHWHILTAYAMRSFNPGRIDPTNAAWNSSRKPLVAHWETPSGTRFFTVNLHLTAKLGGTSTQGDARPPINAGVDQRTSQVKTVAVSRSCHLLGCDAGVGYDAMLSLSCGRAGSKSIKGSLNRRLITACTEL